MEYTVFSTYKRFIEITFIKKNIFLHDGSYREGLDHHK